MNMKRFIISILCLMFLTISTKSYSMGSPPRNYGRYFCQDCGVSNAAAAMGDIYIFLRSTKITQQWVPGDTVTICDGNSCMPITWRGTAWQPLGPPYVDNKSSYKNGTSVSGILPPPNTYNVNEIWVSPSGPVKNYIITVGDLVPVGPGSGSGVGVDGAASIGTYAPGGNNLTNDPNFTGCF